MQRLSSLFYQGGIYGKGMYGHYFGESTATTMPLTGEGWKPQRTPACKQPSQAAKESIVADGWGVNLIVFNIN